MDYQKTIAVDFDGTLCDHEYPSIGQPKPGGAEALRLFKSLGYRILIYTCRTCRWHEDIFGDDPDQPVMQRSRVLDMVDWLKDNNMVYDEIDDGTRGKPLADFYIDDKAIHFSDNWKDIMEGISSVTN